MREMIVTIYGVDFNIRQDTDKDCLFLFGVRKSGSSILNSIVEAMANASGYNYLDVAGDLFMAGVPVSNWQADPALRFLIQPGNLLGGFRDFPAGMVGSSVFAQSRKVLLVRDPRDALVSEYFSNARTHALPESGDSRDEMLKLRREALDSDLSDFVISRAPLMQHTMLAYEGIVDMETTLVMRYEDVILQKSVLIDEVANHFGWTLTPEVKSQIIEWADVVPTSEDQGKFVRKVLPGDHIEKLSTSVISQLNEILRPSLSRFGYQGN